MFPPVYRTLRTPAVIALVGERIGRHGEVPQGTPASYITWQLINGNPFDTLSETPQGDNFTLQIDCYASTDGGIETLASAVRDALDAAGVTNRIVINGREAETRLYRVGFEADFIASR